MFALVLTPTRELALQISEVMKAVGAPLRLRVAVAIGGGSMVEQTADVSRRPHVVVATPGRLKEMVLGGDGSMGKVFAKLQVRGGEGEGRRGDERMPALSREADPRLSPAWLTPSSPPSLFHQCILVAYPCCLHHLCLLSTCCQGVSTSFPSPPSHLLPLPQFLVLDEADRLLDPSFQADMSPLLASLPTKRQTLLFSATFTASLQKLQVSEGSGDGAPPLTRPSVAAHPPNPARAGRPICHVTATPLPC